MKANQLAKEQNFLMINALKKKIEKTNARKEKEHGAIIKLTDIRKLNLTI